MSPDLQSVPSSVPQAWPRVFERLRAVRSVLAVARCGSAVKAGEAIHLSQPAVTRAVLDVERTLGVALFDRIAGGMVATAPGRQVVRRASVMFEQLAAGALDARAAAFETVEVRHGERFAAIVSAAGLKALLAVARSGSEAGAGLALGLSQSAVHRALRELERQVGTVLVHASPRGTRLSHAGEALLRRAKLTLSEALALESDLAAWRGELRGQITIGVLPLSVAIFLPRAVDTLLRCHPAVNVRIVDGTYESLVQMLLVAEVDLILGALRSGPGSAELRQEVLFDDELAVVARAGHPCLARTGLGLAELLQWPWVVPLPGSPAAAAVQRVFSMAGLPAPAGSLQASSPMLTREIVLQTGRLAIASRRQVCELEADDGARLCVVPVALPGTRRPIGMILRAISAPAPDLAALLDALRAAVA